MVKNYAGAQESDTGKGPLDDTRRGRCIGSRPTGNNRGKGDAQTNYSNRPEACRLVMQFAIEANRSADQTGGTQP